MSTEFDDPFADYDKVKAPEWFTKPKADRHRAYREKKAGRTLGQWGGKRNGAGRKATNPKINVVEGLNVGFKLNRIQELSLKEMGDGDVNKGIQALIDKYL